MTSDAARLHLLEGVIRKHIPRFEVRGKDKGPGSGWQKIIAVLIWVFNRRYLTGFISTFYPLVYWTTLKEYKEDPKWSFKVLAHEGIHLFDAQDYWFWFGFSYLLPAVLVPLALGSLAAIWASNWFLMFLVALVFLLPLPAYWRMKWELRGYAMSMAVNAWKYGGITAFTRDGVEKSFTGAAYYFMWPFKKGMSRRIDEVERAIHNGDILQWGSLYRQVHRIIKFTDQEAIALAEHGGSDE